MLLLLALASLSLVTLGSLVVYQKQSLQLSSKKEMKFLPETPVVERTLTTLQTGDVIAIGSQDWLIVESLRYREEDEIWFWHRLEGGTSKKSFFEVRHRKSWTAAFFEPVDDLPTFGSFGNGLTFRDQPYQLECRGQAHIQPLAETGEIAREKEIKWVQYSSFRGPGAALLNVEERDGIRSGFKGERVSEQMLSLMPGQALGTDDLKDFSEKNPILPE